MTTTHFHTPPANQGQIVEISYASAERYVIKRKLDFSDGETHYYVSRALVVDDGDYWNAFPNVKDFMGRMAARPAYQRAMQATMPNGPPPM